MRNSHPGGQRRVRVPCLGEEEGIRKAPGMGLHWSRTQAQPPVSSEAWVGFLTSPRLSSSPAPQGYLRVDPRCGESSRRPSTSVDSGSTRVCKISICSHLHKKARSRGRTQPEQRFLTTGRQVLPEQRCHITDSGREPQACLTVPGDQAHKTLEERNLLCSSLWWSPTRGQGALVSHGTSSPLRTTLGRHAEEEKCFPGWAWTRAPPAPSPKAAQSRVPDSRPAAVRGPPRASTPPHLLQ